VRPTKHSSRWIVVLLIVAGLAATALSACSSATEEEAAAVEAASVEPIKGTSYNTIKLTADAVERVGLKTGTIAEKRVAGKQRKVIPYAAVSYTPNGGTFAYTSPEPRTFVRRPISVETVRKGEAILSRGPPVGTAVVTVGSAELFGVEYEFEPE
jgi:ABC-type Fe3+-hydroxamate transport system substrate-binding protein